MTEQKALQQAQQANYSRDSGDRITGETEYTNDSISIEEFIVRLPEWNMSQYVFPIQGKKMLSLQGANFVAGKCGISIISVGKTDETDEYIDMMAVGEYRGRTDHGIKRQYKKDDNGKDVRAPLENAVSKARRNAICALIPHDIIVGQATAPLDSPYIKAAKAIEAAHVSAQNAGREQIDSLSKIGLTVNIILEEANSINGDDTSKWGVMQWEDLESMIRNPAKYELGKPIDDKADESTEEVDESDVEEVGI